MKILSLTILSVFLLFTSLTFTACSRKPVDPSIPEALQDSEGEVQPYLRVPGRRGHTDLVDELFAEILEKRPEVKAIVDEQIQMLDDIQQKSRELHRSDGKSNEFYASARSHATSIADSISSIAILAKIDASEARWKASLADRDALSDQLNQRSLDLQDELLRLKIRLTLPQIEDYQRKNRPNLDGAKALEKEALKLLKQMQTIPEK